MRFIDIFIVNFCAILVSYALEKHEVEFYKDMKKYMKGVLSSIILGGLFLSVMPTAYAGDFTARTSIVSVRSYVQGAYFVTLASSALKAGGTCTTVYKVSGDAAGAKTIIATLLTAKATGSQVELEVPTGCPDGWGSLITSVVVY